MNGSRIAFVSASIFPVLVWFLESVSIKFLIWILNIFIWFVDLKYLKLCKISIKYFAKLPFTSADLIEKLLTLLFNFLKKYNIQKENALLFGDKKSDELAALKAGITNENIYILK